MTVNQVIPTHRWLLPPRAFSIAFVLLAFSTPVFSENEIKLDSDYESTPIISSEAGRKYGEAVLLEAGNLPAASIDAFQECLDKEPKCAYLQLRLAGVLLEFGKAGEAAQVLKPLAESDPDNAGMLRLLGRIAYRQRKLDEALAFYEKSLEDQPKNIEALQSLAGLYYEHKRDMAKTREICGRILERDGRNLHALLYSAEAGALSGDMEHTKIMYRRLLHYRPEMSDRLDDLAQRLAKRGRRADALSLYSEGLRIAPDSDLLQRGFESLTGDGASTATLQAYRDLAIESPGSAGMQRLYARRLQDAEKWMEAEAQYQKVLALQPGDISSLIAMADIAYQRGDIKLAIERYETALDHHPADPDIYCSAARIYLAHNEAEKARRTLRDALALDPRHAKSMVLLADMAEKEGDLAAAEQLLKQSLDALPANSTLLGLLASYYVRHERHSEAMEILEQLLATRQRDIGLYSQLLNYYLRFGRDASAASLADRGREFFEDSLDFDLILAQTAFSQNDPGFAEECLLRILQANPSHLDARRLLAAVYMSVGEQERSVKVLRDIEKSNFSEEDRFRWTMAMAGALIESRKYPEAADYFQKALTQRPESLDAISGRLESLIQSGKSSDANLLLNEAVRKLNADKPREIQLIRARVLSLQKQTDRAISALRNLAKEYPKDSEIWFALAVAYSEKKDVENSEEAYRKTIQLEPSNATAYNNLGYMICSQPGRLTEARELVEAALALRPGANFALDSLGWIYFLEGNYDLAIDHIQQAWRNSGGADAEISEHLGDIYQKKGDTFRARLYYQEALRIDPERQQLRDKLKALGR